jgi:medium-chain acyl-[acyl-carrier-protein] hydrolase
MTALSSHPAPAPRPRRAVRLLCLPYAGGGSATYAPWRRAAPTGLEVRPVELPGRQARFGQAPIDRIEPLVELLRSELTPTLEPPWALFGHSFGATVAFELARALRRHGAPRPLALFVSAARPPHEPASRQLHRLPDAELIAAIADFGGAPPELLSDAQLQRLVLPALRADFAALETYRFAPGPPLDVPLVAFGGVRDRIVPPAMLAGWRRHSTASAAVRLLPGDHFFVERERGLLLGALAREIDLIERREGGEGDG